MSGGGKTEFAEKTCGSEVGRLFGLQRLQPLNKGDQMVPSWSKLGSEVLICLLNLIKLRCILTESSV